MSAVPSAVFRKISFPHNGKIVTIDQLTYHEPPSQNPSETTISSVTNKQTVDSLTSVSPGVYKDSSLLGTFPCRPPPLIPDPSLSNVCMMQSSQAALKRPASASPQPPLRPPQPPLRPPQPAPSHTSLPTGPPPSGLPPIAGIPEPLYPPGLVPLGLNHLRAVPPSH